MRRSENAPINVIIRKRCGLIFPTPVMQNAKHAQGIIKKSRTIKYKIA